jgi:hypothetical protein
MVDIANEVPQDPYEVHENKKQTYGIKLLALNIHTHAVIVAVRILALAFIPAQGVPGRKCLFYTDFKHLRFWLIGRPGAWP